MMRLNPHVHVPVNLNFFSIRVNKVVVQVVAYTTSLRFAHSFVSRSPNVKLPSMIYNIFQLPMCNPILNE